MTSADALEDGRHKFAEDFVVEESHWKKTERSSYLKALLSKVVAQQQRG